MLSPWSLSGALAGALAGSSASPPGDAAAVSGVEVSGPAADDSVEDVGTDADPADAKGLSNSAPVAELAPPTVEGPAVEGPAVEVPAVEVPAVEGPEEEPPVDEDLFEDPEDDPSEWGERAIEVTADPLGKGNKFDAFRHAGGRSIVDVEQMREAGAASVGEALQRTPGVRSIEGNSGVGSTDSKLNVGVRGVNPRLSSRATVMLDDVPLAPAPYGQPQMSLFPISVFSVDRIDAVRGGASVRFGPQTSGGVFNLISKPIPEDPRVAVFVQGDSNLDFGLATAYGGTHRKLGIYVEYNPRFGRTWREHSDRQIHGGLLKLSYPLTDTLTLTSTSHVFFEESELPGGVNRETYDADPFASQRTTDQFKGDRQGTALKLAWTPNDDHALSTVAYYNRTFRTTTLADNYDDRYEKLIIQPRTYHVTGVEPRYVGRFEADGVSQEFSLGARALFEFAHLERLNREAAGTLPANDDDAKVAAYAGFMNSAVTFLDGSLRADLGLRAEVVNLGRRDNLATDCQPGEERCVLERRYVAPLPAASLWYSPVDGLAFDLAYGRSFGPPQYLQVSAATSDRKLVPEVADSVEFGVKVEELAGFEGSVTPFYKAFADYLDVGQDSVDNIGDLWTWGVETDIAWYPFDVWDAKGELEIYAGHIWLDSELRGGNYDGNKVAWYPDHEAWAGANYAFDFGFKFGVDYSYTGEQFTDFNNQVGEPVGGSAKIGQIPDYHLVNVWTRYRTADLPNFWQLEITAGIKNVGDVRYFTRTDDINAGILALRPRTFYVNLGFSHDFIRTGEPRQRKKRRKQAGRLQSAAGSGPLF